MRSTMKFLLATSAVRSSPSILIRDRFGGAARALVIVEHVGSFLHVQFARLAVGADAIPIEDAIGQVTGLLRLEQDDACTDRVQRSGGQVIRLACFDRHAPQNLAERAVGHAPFVLFARRVARPAVDEFGAFVRRENVPALGFAVVLMLDALCIGVIRDAPAPRARRARR